MPNAFEMILDLVEYRKKFGIDKEDIRRLIPLTQVPLDVVSEAGRT